MKKAVLTVLLFVSQLMMLGCAVDAQSSQPPVDPDLTALAKYREWSLVNPVRQTMAPTVAASCAIYAAPVNPHVSKFLSVFVNSVGREAMMTQKRPKFPVGSMIVKEKFANPEDKDPELLTAMIKREAGYNPDNGDWEFLVLDGAASKMVERGRLTRCSGCHSSYGHNDFVTRTYLPQSVKDELK
jgi:cytochrome P460